jgi:hypothetical protein
VPPKERLKALTKVQNDILAEIKGLTEEATETPAPAPKQKRTRRKKADIDAEEEVERAKAREDLRTSEREPTEDEQLAKSLDLAASVEAAQKAGTWPPPTPAEAAAAQAAASPGLTLMEHDDRVLLECLAHCTIGRIGTHDIDQIDAAQLGGESRA